MDRERASPATAVSLWLAWVSFLAAGTVIVLHLRFVLLPLFFFLLGIVSYTLAGRRALLLYLFLLPLINSLPDLFFNGYPFNYMAVSLFYLAGLILGSRLKRERLPLAFPGSRAYLLFLTLLFVSVLFVFLRWSNLLHSPLAFLRDTPIAPDGQRLSFGAIFPVITIFLFSFSPLLAALMRLHRISVQQALIPLSLGLSLSVGLALMQRLAAPDFLCRKWWVEQMNHVNGGFSDFNAFGFFSGLLLLGQTVSLASEWKSLKPWRRTAAVPLLLFSLAGIFLSGCRTAFLFVLAAFAYSLCSRRLPLLMRAGFVGVVAVLFLAAGGTLKQRVFESFEHLKRLNDAPSLVQDLDKLTNKRVTMIKNSIFMTRRTPLVGVGAGNFLFYLKYLHFGIPHYEDLPLNQYLLILDELGLCGLVVFLFFLWRLGCGLPNRWKFPLLVTALTLLLNFFFWFPECILLFFALFTGATRVEPSSRLPARRAAAVGILLLALSLAGHLLSWRSLDPVVWAKEKNTLFDYGFWYPERGLEGEFRWSLSRAGIYLYGDRPQRIRLSCAAPLHLIRGGKQSLRIYWRGKFQRLVTFLQNGEILWLPPSGQEGFWEIRVTPVFNLKSMGQGNENRDLGIQVYLER
jgi:hypothetical protein